MKLKKNLSVLAPVVIVAICNILFLASIPKSIATGYSRVRYRPCSSLQCSNLGSGNNLYGARGVGGVGGSGRRNRALLRNDMFDQLNEIFSIPVRFNSILQEEYQRQLSQAPLHHKSQYQYEINEDESKMELNLDVPGIDASDIVIQLEQGGQVLRVKGSRNYKHHNRETESKFDQTFTIDRKTVDIDKLEASLNNGVLVISVPKLQQSTIEEKQRIIPIVDTSSKGKGGNDIHNSNDSTVQKEKKEEISKEERDIDDLEITEEEDI
jgi:HSP20 family protein